MDIGIESIPIKTIVLSLCLVCWSLSLSLILAKKLFNFSVIVLGSFDVPSSVISSSGILGPDDWPLRSFICFHRYELSLFSAIDFEKKSFIALQMREFVLFRQNLY